MPSMKLQCRPTYGIGGITYVMKNKQSLLQIVKGFSMQRRISKSHFSSDSTWENSLLPEPLLDESYICDPKNRDEIISNIGNRKGVGDIDRVLQLYNEVLNMNTENKSSLVNRDLLVKEMLKIPNQTHPEIIKYDETPRILKYVGDKKYFDFKPDQFHNIATSMNLLRNDVSNFTGHRSYFFTSQLSELESAMIKYYLSKLLDVGFQLISVPDILHRTIIESCGMETKGKRCQVYNLSSDHHGSDKCLSGTAEMGVAAYLMNKDLAPDQLPLRLAAVSRCFRAETSRTSDERGIYRVHQFTKVEMFGVSEPERSGELLEEFRVFQEEHFSNLGLHLRVLDMPPHELGAQAYRKYDVESWLPGKEMWAELSSCSDCTDYQSRRLAIRSGDRFVHTVNGTACAVPRLIIALFETHQQSDGSVHVPPPLQPFMRNVSVIIKKSAMKVPKLRLIRRQSKKS